MTTSGPLPLALLALLALGPAGAVSAQTPEPPDGSHAPPVLTRFAYHLDAAPYLAAEPRFTWSANFGGDVDIWDYGTGRLTGLVNYEVILDRFLDPSQGNYVIEFSSSVRLPRAAEGAVFVHHLSRHLSDKPKRMKVAWNVVGVRLARRYSPGRSRIDTRVQGGWMTISRAFVDYRWEAQASVRWLFRVHPRWMPLMAGQFSLVGVHADEAQRNLQRGARAEVGVRLPGRAADFEAFLAWEQRIDPYPTERGIGRWGMFGMRIVSR